MSKPPASNQKRALTPVEAFEMAVTRHRAGRLDEAGQLYRAILKINPKHFGALHYLGLAFMQQDKLDEALALLEQAVGIEPNSAEARTNFGIALAAAQRLEEAIGHYKKAIDLQPSHVEAHNNLGISLQRLERQEEARAQFAAALALNPDNPFVLNNFGSALAALGRHPEAITAYEKALQCDPRFAEAANHLGMSLAALDQHEAAIEHFFRAIALKPDYAEAQGNMGAALNRLARHEEAIAHFEQALALNPGLADAHNDIGHALIALERTEEAVERFRRALAIRPRFRDAHHNLGNALVLLERHGQAIAHFKTALALDPSAFETLISLARALAFIERYDESISTYHQALELRPDEAEVHRLLGSALEASGRAEDAIASHERALAINPEFANAWSAMGTSLITLGRLSEGREAIERAIALAPKRPDFHRTLAMSKQFAPGDVQLRAMEDLARDLDAFNETQRMELQFALGKAYADLGRRDEALRQLLDANAIKRRQIKYDEATTLAQLDEIRKVMTRDLMQRKSGSGAASETPIFILGMPRSGSTLIEQILASHPVVFGAGELGHFAQAVASLRGEGSPPALFTDFIVDMPNSRFEELGRRYLDSIRTLAPESLRITDKMPANFRMAGLIHLALPQARIIHSRRDPLDTCLSCFEREFAKNHQGFSYDLAELGRYFRAYESLMAHWRDVLPPGVMLDVQYEELVADFEPQARRLLAHCGVDWDARCLAFHKTKRPIHTSSVVQVREPLYRSSVGRWQPVKHLLRPLLDELGL